MLNAPMSVTGRCAVRINSAWGPLGVFLSSFRGLLNFKFVALFCMLGLMATHGFAQDITMPEVDIDGIDGDSTGDQILITIMKFVARIAIWVVMVIAGFLAIKTMLKSWNEQKQNDQGRWGAVIGDSIGSIIMAIAVIALGTWVLTFLS